MCRYNLGRHNELGCSYPAIVGLERQQFVIVIVIIIVIIVIIVIGVIRIVFL